MRVPRARVRDVHGGLREALLAAVDPVLFGDIEAGTDALDAFEQAFATTCRRRHVFGVQSGTAGLFLALRACGIGPGHEVITVGNSDISTTAAISHCGATPVLCDVLPTDFTIDPGRVADLVTPRTRAVLPVDLYGHPADVQALREIAGRHGLQIIEDAALAAGAHDHGHPVGAFADVTVFSFAPYKPLGTVGSGGVVATDDPAIARTVRTLRGYGASPEEPPPAPGYQAHVAEGYHLPLDGLQASVLSVKLPHLGEWTRSRRAVADAYAEGLRDLPVGVPRFRAESEPTFRQYTVCVRERDEVYRRLRRAMVEVVLHYVPPVHRQPVYAGRTLPGAGRLPVTEQLAASLICLPVFPEISRADIDYVIDAMRDALRTQH
jgi:dTDP-3-amino-3,4,6-trideoxy-alpha-D-glucose transaminase